MARPLTRVELVLANGAVRALDLPAGTSSIGNALARLDAWIETADGDWVQKSHVVEVRIPHRSETAGAALEYEALDAAAGAIIHEAGPHEGEQRPSGSDDRHPAEGV